MVSHLSDVRFKSFSSNDSEIDAENQSNIYNTVTKDYPGPNAANGSKEGILARMKNPYFDEKGTMYALQDNQYIGYCSSIQVTHNIIRIGYPWSYANVGQDIKRKLVDQVIEYYQEKVTNEQNPNVDFEVYTLDYRWTTEITFMKEYGFKFHSSWRWPFIRVESEVIPLPDLTFELTDATEADVDNLLNIISHDTENARYNDLPTETLRNQFTSMLTLYEYVKVLRVNNKVVGMVALYLPKDDEGTYLTERYCNLSPPSVLTQGLELEYTRIMVKESLLYAKSKGFAKCLSWFEENTSMDKSVKQLYDEDSIKWISLHYNP